MNKTKSIELEKIYSSERAENSLEMKYDRKNKERPSWIKIDLDKKAVFIKILADKEAFWYRRYFRDYFFPLNSTSLDYENYYDEISEDYESFIPQNKEIAKFLINLFKEYLFIKSTSILDVGAGTGIVTEEIAKQGYNKITLLDISQKELDVAKKKPSLANASFQKKDLTKEEIEGKYDLIFETMALDYFKEDALSQILEKIKRALNTRGKIICIDRHIPPEFERIFKKLKSGSIQLDTPEGKFDYYFFVGEN